MVSKLTTVNARTDEDCRNMGAAMDDRPSGTNETPPPQLVTFDAILPAAMALRAEENGVRRAGMDPVTLLVLSVLGGAFVAFGAIFATTVSAGSIPVTSIDGTTALSAGLPYGIVRLLTGLAFTVGLILVVIGGAELFTGNNLIVMAWASGRVTSRDLLTNWVIAFSGNFVGAFFAAGLMFYSTQYTFGGGSVGLVALTTAHAKTSLAFMPALTLGIMCNALVCLAIWMCYSARTTIDRIITIVPPIAAFAAAGFEHSIANIYFIPMGLFIKAGAPDSFWASIGKTAADFPNLTWDNFLIGNLIPVTIGNIIGGSVMVGAVYWFVYLRKRPA
jgi:formate transporter